MDEKHIAAVDDLVEQAGIVPADAQDQKGAASRALARRIEEAPTIQLKSQLLWALPAAERHSAMSELSPEDVAMIIESKPDENTALLGNLPAQKFFQVVNLGPPETGRLWLERAVSSGHLAAQMLPALLPPRDLMYMLMTSPDVRRALPRLLNFRRATEMRTLLHPLEWKTSLDDLLLADAEELLTKAPIKNRAAKAVLQSVLDFYPEAYLETIRLSLERAKHDEDRPTEFADLTETPFEMPDFLTEEARATNTDAAQVGATASQPEQAPSKALSEIIPASNDGFLALATSRLGEERRELLERELRDLLRQEIVAAGSFSEADLARSAGRLIFQLRAGLEHLGAHSPEEASMILETRSLAEASEQGARTAERYRQRALQLAGLKDWLDARQKQFLVAMRTPEAGIDSKTGEPVFFLSSRAGQAREDWTPATIGDVEAKLEQISAWAGFARAAFGMPARVQTIFATAKTKTADEAVRRTVIALCLYRRWEPELVRPGEDYVPFRRQFADSLGRLNAARQVVLDALDATPAQAWKPADSSQKARQLMLDAVDQLEKV